MKHALAAFAVLSALLCFAILAYAWDIQTVSELDDLEDIVDTT